MSLNTVIETMQIKDKTYEVVKENPRIAMVAIGALSSMVVLTVLSFIEPASAQFKVCNADGLSTNMQEQFRRLTSFVVGGAVIAAILLAVYEHLQDIAGEGGKEITKSDKIKGAIVLVIGLYFVQFALSSILQVQVSCIMPWGSNVGMISPLIYT